MKSTKVKTRDGETHWSHGQVKDEGDFVRVGDDLYNKDQIVKIEEPRSSGCFVATEIYGNANCYQVDSLKYIRDKYLASSKLGQWFINRYYNGLGQSSSSMIKKNLSYCKPILRLLLDILIKGFDKLENGEKRINRTNG